MKHKFLIGLFLIFSSVSLFSQINFEAGYFIDNSGSQVNCFIKNVDWNNNPKEFQYKTSLATTDVFNGSIDSVKEFGIISFSKYVRADINIDKSANFTGDFYGISDTSAPIWQKERLFLKVLLEGKATLYYYQTQNISKFFYSVNNSNIVQLVYKEYTTNRNNLKVNNEFQNQLQAEVQCNKTQSFVLERMSYKTSELLSYFKKYNSCFNDATSKSDYSLSNHSDFLKINAVTNFNSSSIASQATPQYTNSGKNFMAGLALEYMLGFNRNKYSVVLEYTTGKTKFDGGNTLPQIQYNNTDFIFGARHYMYLNKKLSISLSLFLCNSIRKKFKMNSNDYSNLGSNSSGFKFVQGLGVNYNKFAIECRLNGAKEYVNFTYPGLERTSRVSMLLTYNIFATKHTK